MLAKNLEYQKPAYQGKHKLKAIRASKLLVDLNLGHNAPQIECVVEELSKLMVQ